MNKIVFATNNLNKLSEIRDLVPEEIKILSLVDINCNEELAETQNTLEENAMQKARYVFTNYGYNCFADDTGLEIDDLDGDPGIYSARYAGEHRSEEDNIEKVLSKLINSSNRNARFRTVFALIINSEENFFEDECNGSNTRIKSGVEGFGYDSIFMPEGYDITFAEMTQQEKATEFASSMRGQYILSQALWLGIEKLTEVQPEHIREESNISDMKFLLHNIFPMFAAVMATSHGDIRIVPAE